MEYIVKIMPSWWLIKIPSERPAMANRLSGCRKRQKRFARTLPYAPDRRYIGRPLISKNGVISHLESARERGREGVPEDFLDWNKVAVAPLCAAADHLAVLSSDGQLPALSLRCTTMGQSECSLSLFSIIATLPPAAPRSPSHSPTAIYRKYVCKCVRLL